MGLERLYLWEGPWEPYKSEYLSDVKLYVYQIISC